MAWYDLGPVNNQNPLLFKAASNADLQKINKEENLGLKLNSTDDEGTVAFEPADPYALSTVAPSKDKLGLDKLAGQNTDNTFTLGSLLQAQNLVNSIGDSSIYGSTPSNKTDFAAILHNLRLYNSGNEVSADTAAFYDMINEALNTLGIDSESDYAQYYIKELIKSIANSDKDLTKMASNGIELTAENLAQLDTNCDGSFMDELATLSLSDEVLKNAQKEITKAQISDEMDSDNDGYITLEEMVKSFNNNGTIASLFTDDKGNFDAALFYAVADTVGGQYKVTPMVLLAWLDTNNDGKITADEVKQFKQGKSVDPNSPKDNPVYVDAYQRGVDYLNK